MTVKREVCHICLFVSAGSRVVQEWTGRRWDRFMWRGERKETDFRKPRGERGGKECPAEEEISS